MRIGTRNRNRRRIQVVCLDWGDNSNVSLSMGITWLMVYGVFPNQSRGSENRRNIAEDKPVLSSAQETSSSISTPSLKQLADNLQTPARWTMQRFILPSQTILTHPPRGEATHRSFRVNVLHVIYTIPYTIYHYHPRHHNHHHHHHRWITPDRSDSIDSRRWKSHGVNNKCLIGLFCFLSV